MAFEMCCGRCNQNILIEMTGVVVACPHCGAHLSIPADIPDMPRTTSDGSETWSMPPTASLPTSDNPSNDVIDEFSDRETIIVPRSPRGSAEPLKTGFQFDLVPGLDQKTHSDVALTQSGQPGWPTGAEPPPTAAPKAAELTKHGSSSETTPDFSWLNDSTKAEAVPTPAVNLFDPPQVSKDAAVNQDTPAAKTTPDFSWMSDTVPSPPSPLSFTHPHHQLHFADPNMAEADSPFAGTVIGGMEDATAAMPDFSATLHSQIPPSEPVSIQLQPGPDEGTDQPPTLCSPTLTPALYGTDGTNPTIVLEDASNSASPAPFDPARSEPTEPMMSSLLPQIDPATASASMATFSVQMRPHAMTHTTEMGSGHPPVGLPPQSNQMTLIILGSYASLLTIYVLYVTFFARPHQLESLPDLKTVQQAGGRVVVPRPEDNLPAGHQLKLGQTERFGNLKVTPLKVTRGPMLFSHYSGDSARERDASDPVLKLWIRFENVSNQQTIAPLDTTLLSFHPFVKDGVRSFNVIFRELDRRNRDATVYYPFDRLAADSEWRIVDQHTNEALPPHGTFDSFVPSQEGIDDLEGNVVWRVHFRKGFGPHTGNGVTTLIDVEFNTQDIQPDA